MPMIIGIDLGTTFSCVAAIGADGKSAETILNQEGENTTPSVVAYSDGKDGKGSKIGKVYVGKPATVLVASAQNVIYDSKRFIGRQFDDVSVQDDMKYWHFNVIKENNKPLVHLVHQGVEKRLSAEEISAEILKKLKDAVMKQFNDKDIKAVITVPANFDQRQRHATMEAAKLAGIEVIQLISEPIAAAIAYGIISDKEQKILVYDFGGGTFDAYVAAYDKNKTLTGLAIDKGADDEWNLELTLSKFNELCWKTIQGTIEIVNYALQCAKLNENDIDIVVLVGGSTRIQLVNELLQKKFGKEKIWSRLNPNEVVAKGAALTAKILLEKGSKERLKVAFNDILPLSIGQIVRGGLMIPVFKRGTKYPCIAEEITELVIDRQCEAITGIYQGERKICKYNYKIGNIKLKLNGETSKRKDKIKTIYRVDENGLLSVTSIEVKNTRNTAPIEIQYDGFPHTDMCEQNKFEFSKIANEYLGRSEKLPERIESKEIELKEILLKEIELYQQELREFANRISKFVL
ncbi:hypothetical protein WR25_25261 [Diploscapter pachys]|uniref:Uncharacterized protein n=1 Tax=Diploscapter pachys TaxID=2018661 RepID=A0A2A2J8X0_9BILA|nr:hypothetical protein WR25_25261 [Diploscapter pachys]